MWFRWVERDIDIPIPTLWNCTIWILGSLLFFCIPTMESRILHQSPPLRSSPVSVHEYSPLATWEEQTRYLLLISSKIKIGIFNLINEYAITYGHRSCKAWIPIRSSIIKPRIGMLVVGSVTTSESLLLYVFCNFFAIFLERIIEMLQ